MQGSPQFRGASFQPGRQRPQASLVAPAGRVGIALELSRQRVESIAKAGGVPLAPGPKIAGSVKSRFTARPRSGWMPLLRLS